MLPSDEFLPTTKFKMIHDFFLKHYSDSKFDAFEERPTDNKQSGKIILYEITVSKYADYCNFEDSEQLVNDFFK